MDQQTSHVSFFVPTSLREALERQAQQHDRSLSAEIRVAIRSHVFDSPGTSSRDVHQPPGESEESRS